MSRAPQTGSEIKKLLAKYAGAEMRARQLLFIYGPKSPEFMQADEAAQALRDRIQESKWISETLRDVGLA